MNRPRASARCYRCPASYVAHGPGEACPDGQGTFARRAGWRPATSFSAAEVDWLSDVLAAVEERKSLRPLTSQPQLASVARKAHSLTRAVARAKADRDRAERTIRSNKKLNASLVREIRAARAAGARTDELAARHGVTCAAINRAVRRETWAHVE